ncbi:InlB B-repeat-containing protein [Bifidobacterium sp. ESL0690]|uniref:leucine-rich repeat domain-containing protein n=1 Tax=Bifidobacterium sp. ESL0690 TaxID=2983214 RepID=UPI0023F76405|nr:leucine-rich repeat domain-containing protein [Bifidobacterium sp. ESL0690]WEV46776.1 InlB B-repeat-containing protein [Bifidobacterium sp. ESL0690]
MASQKGKGVSSADSSAKYVRHSGFQTSQSANRVSSDAVGLPGRIVNDIGFNASYTLTYDANGGTEAPLTKADTGQGVQTCSSQHVSGEVVTLSAGATDNCQKDNPIRDGMKFVGWSATKLAPFDTFSDAENHVMTTMTMPAAPQTMYAIWVRDSYTVTFKTQMDSNGVASSAIILKTDTVAAGETPVPPTSPTPYNQGLKFMGWGVSKDSTDASGEGMMTTFDATAPVNSNETVWALWGYEDTSAGHRCVMSVDTVATCFPDQTLAHTVVSAAQATDAHHTTDVWTLRDALHFGDLNYDTTPGHGLDDNPLNISELDGLQTLTGLGRLHISNVTGNTLNTHSRDLHQLKYLDKMENLFANGDGITDVSNLSGMSHLQILYLTDNSISDLSGLSRLWDLQTLKLDNNRISDLSGLIVSPTEHLSRLTELDLNNNAIVHVSPLAPLTTLKTLKLQNNQIPSIVSLSPLQGMYALYLDNNKIDDISVIKRANFQYLTMLGLSSNKISDIGSLRDVTTLKQLWLHHNEISDVSPLAGLTNLTMLYIGSNHIRDISSLSGLTGLDWGTPDSCDFGTSSFCADNQTVTLSDTLTADPGLSMPTAVTMKKSVADGSVAGAAVEPTSSLPTSPSSGQFDADHQQVTWAGPMPFNADNSAKTLQQTFSTDAQLPNTTGVFSGTITEPYKVAQHTVTFDPGAGTLPSGQPSSVQVHSGYKITAPASEPSRDGYYFVGWICAAGIAGMCSQGDSFDFANTAVTKDATLSAKWGELANSIPLTGASYKDYLRRGGLAVTLLGLAVACELLRRRAAGR